MKNYDVVYVGNYTKDTIISPAGTRYVDGGAVNYAAHAAAKLGMKVAVVTRLSKEDDHVVEKFTAIRYRLLSHLYSPLHIDEA